MNNRWYELFNHLPIPNEVGNINLFNRPVVRNSDGSISTVRSMSFNDNGREILVPTVSNDGKIMTEDQAIQNYYNTGQHLGKFSNPNKATNYAKMLHVLQDIFYGGQR